MSEWWVVLIKSHNTAAVLEFYYVPPSRYYSLPPSLLIFFLAKCLLLCLGLWSFFDLLWLPPHVYMHARIPLTNMTIGLILMWYYLKTIFTIIFRLRRGIGLYFGGSESIPWTCIQHIRNTCLDRESFKEKKQCYNRWFPKMDQHRDKWVDRPRGNASLTINKTGVTPLTFGVGVAATPTPKNPCEASLSVMGVNGGLSQQAPAPLIAG